MDHWTSWLIRWQKSEKKIPRASVLKIIVKFIFILKLNKGLGLLRCVFASVVPIIQLLRALLMLG